MGELLSPHCAGGPALSQKGNVGCSMCATASGFSARPGEGDAHEAPSSPVQPKRQLW
jgi:hypothetical protein